MTEQDKFAELADILGTTDFDATTALNTLRWDSMALLAYLALLRSSFNKILPNVRQSDFITIADLLKHMQ